MAESKDQLISKSIYGLLTSPKERTDEFVLFAFLLFTANKSNSSVRFLGESTACQSAFQFYLTFRHSTGFVKASECLLYLKSFHLDEQNVLLHFEMQLVKYSKRDDAQRVHSM